MSALMLFVTLGASFVLGVLVGIEAGAARLRRRLWEAARHAPSSSVALATLERAMRAQDVRRDV
jgi:hypothetical protein